MRARVLLVPLVAGVAIVGIALATSAPNSSSHVGSLVRGGEMLSPRSGHSATCCPMAGY